MKLKELCEAMKPIPSDYDVEYDKIISSHNHLPTHTLPTHLSHLNRNTFAGAILSIPALKKELAKLSDDDLIWFVLANPSYFQYITNPSDDVIKFALRRDGMNLKYLPKMNIPTTDEFIKIAVRSNGKAIGWVDNPTEDQMMRAVSKNSLAIHNIMKPYSKKLTPGKITPDVLAIANKKNQKSATSMLVKHGQLSNDEVSAAIKASPDVILQMKTPTPEQVELALNTAPRLLRAFVQKRFPISEPKLMDALKPNPSLLHDLVIYSPHLITPDMIKLALTNQSFIDMKPSYWSVSDSYPYDTTVKLLFKNNNILTKKWLRYGETMRNQ
jgi:hypothetical protein